MNTHSYLTQIGTQPHNTMDEAHVAWNGVSPWCSPHEIRKRLANILLQISQIVLPYWWRLIDDGPESLCKLLQITESEMISILEAAEVVAGNGEVIKLPKFEVFAELLDCEIF